MKCQNEAQAINRSKEECLLILRTYKNLTESKKNHESLIEQKTPLLYPATLLEEKDPIVVNLSLDVLENFISNEDNHSKIISTFGIYEALHSLSLRKRDRNYQLSERAGKLVESLRTSAPPAYGTRSRSTRTEYQKKNTVYLLEFPELNETTKKKLEKVLVRTKGVISFLIDMDKNRSTVRLCQKTSVKYVAEKIFEMCKMTAKLVSRDPKSGREILQDLLDFTLDSSMLEYYIDDESPPKNTALSNTINFVKTGNSLFKSVAGFWNESFYW